MPVRYHLVTIEPKSRRGRPPVLAYLGRWADARGSANARDYTFFEEGRWIEGVEPWSPL